MSLVELPHKTFDQLMSLEELDPAEFSSLATVNVQLFRSLVKPYQPQVAPGVFGGHVLAQTSLAAARTTPKDFICHNIHGYFLLPGQRDIPFYYQVEKIRNGSNFLVRQVKVFQNSDISRLFSAKSICFIAIVSLKRPTPRGSLNHQRHLPEDFKLTNVFDSLEDHELAPDADVPQWQELVKSGKLSHSDEYHPIEIRKRDMKSVNDDKKVYERSQIHYFKANEPISDNQNVHVAAFLYVSDRNSLFTILNLQEKISVLNKAASIDHSFVLHDVGARLTNAWNTMETFSSKASDGRGLYQGHIYDKDHNLVCSFMQDGVIRVNEETNKQKESGGKSKL